MKNFDYPYINDSPIDLSGREGYDDEVCDDIDTVLTTPRTFPDVLNEWTNTMLELNKEAVSLDAIAMIGRLGLMGQRLITEANVIGMTEIAKEYK